MYTLDASIFVRDLNPGDPEHAVCRALIERLAAQHIPIVAPTLLLAEVAGVLSRELRDPMRGRVSLTLLQALPNLMLVPLDVVMAQTAAELAADRGLRGADATYVAIAQHHACRLITLDREQRERAAPIIPTQTPAAALADLENGS